MWERKAVIRGVIVWRRLLQPAPPLLTTSPTDLGYLATGQDQSLGNVAPSTCQAASRLHCSAWTARAPPNPPSPQNRDVSEKLAGGGARTDRKGCALGRGAYGQRSGAWDGPKNGPRRSKAPGKMQFPQTAASESQKAVEAFLGGGQGGARKMALLLSPMETGDKDE